MVCQECGPGHFHVVDDENRRDYGTLDGADPHLEAKFQQHLLLEISKADP
jgi:hypothetical protein